MKKFIVSLLCLLVVITGCSREKEETDGSDTVPKMINVSIQTPETMNPNEEVTIKALITQGDEKVDNANEVKFEIWKSGQDEHEMLDGTHQGNGVYSVKTTFREEGTYFIVAHATARDMHNMPKKEIIVGTPNQNTEAEEGQSHDHEHNNVSIEFDTNETITANKQVSLSAHIQNENQPLTNAAVTFEIWKEDQKNHEFIDATEGNDGEYKANKTFSTPGTYEVKVHVKKDEIHEHQQESIEVK